MATAYNLPGVTPPRPNAITANIPSVVTTSSPSQNMSIASSSSSSSSNTHHHHTSSTGSVYNLPGVNVSSGQEDVYNLPGVTPSVQSVARTNQPSSSKSTVVYQQTQGGQISLPSTPGGFITTEAQPPGFWYNVKAFGNRVLNPQSSSLTLSEAWGNIFSNVGRGRVAPGEAALADFYSTQGQVSFYNSPSAEAIKTQRVLFPEAARFVTETAILSGVTEVNAFAKSRSLIALKDTEFSVVAYKTAFSSREVEAGFTPGYKLIARRQTEDFTEKIALDLKSISTGEGKFGFGLSSGTRTLERDKTFFETIMSDSIMNPGKKVISTDFKISGGSESLGFQSKLSRPITLEDGTGKAYGSLSQGFLYQEGKSPISFASVGASRKEAEGVYSIMSSKGALKLKADPNEARLISMNFETEKMIVSQPMSYKGVRGARGTLFDAEFKGTFSSEWDNLGNLGRKGRANIPQDISPNIDTDFTKGNQILKPLTKSETDMISSVTGSFNVLETPKQSMGAFAGLGRYERTTGSIGLEMPKLFSSSIGSTKQISLGSISSFNTLELNQINQVSPTFIDLTNTKIDNNLGLGSISGLGSSYSSEYKLGQSNILTGGSPTPFPTGFDFTGWGGGGGIIIPSLNLDLGGNLSPRRTGKQKKKRTPSLYAALFGITSSTASVGEETGLFLRPIIAERRRKKR